MRMRYVISLASLACVAAFAPCAAFAQADHGPMASGGGLEEVVVTARRREESLQDTPVAVTAFSASDMETRHITSTFQVTHFVPNVQFDSAASESGGGESSQVSIRGIGQTDYVITVEPGVGLYLDGVYIGKSVGSLIDTVDLERIEVLRGPQGTLFGKNTIGGAVLLTSKRPSDKLEFSVEGTVGTEERLDVRTVLSGPLNDRLRLRFSGAKQSRDGHVDRVLTGQEQGDEDNISGRIVAEWDVSPNLLATFSADASYTDEHSPGQVLVRADENAPFAGLHNGPIPSCLAAAGAARFDNPNCFNSQWVRPLDALENFGVGPNSSESKVWGIGATLDWDLHAFSIKSITAFRNVSVDVFQDLTLNPTYKNMIGQDINVQQVSQELQLSGTLFGDRLTYLLGIFWMNESGSQRFPVLLESVEFTSGGSIDNDSTALFAQASYDLTERLGLTVGMRYTYEARSFTPEQQVDRVNNPIITLIFPTATPGTPLFPRVEAEDSDGEFTPQVTVDYDVTDDLLAYFTYSQGFKGGGFTMRGFPPAIPGVTVPITDPERVIPRFGPEKVELFEVGLKSDLFGDHLRLNLAGFVTNYDDLQILTNTGPIQFVPVIMNAGDARLWGVEAEAEIVASNWLRLDASLGWLDHEYLKLQTIPADGIFLDSRLPNAPEWTVHAGATMDVMSNGYGRVYLRGDWSYKSAQYKTPVNVLWLKQDGYHHVNVSLTWESVDGHWRASFGGTNLTDEVYIVSGVNNDGIGYAQAVVSRPREWFLQLKYSY